MTEAVATTERSAVLGRSWLFTPATRPDRFARAQAAGADRLVIDLEDAVPPADKASARTVALDYLSANSGACPVVVLRINAIDTGFGLDDLHGLVAAGASPGHVLLPKTESPDLLVLVDRLLAGSPALRLAALIETAAGLARVEAIAKATPRLDLLMFGAGDMASDLGADGSWDSLLYARSRIVAAARSAGIAAIDSPWFGIDDLEGLEAETRRAAALGFDGKAAIHPRHVPAINERFTPTQDAVERARAIVAAAEAGAAVVDGRMVDEAMARRARRLLRTAGLAPPS